MSSRRTARYAITRNTALRAFNVALRVGCRSSAFMSSRAAAAGEGSRSEQVNDREQDDPDEIDEVPVEPDRLDPLVMSLRVLAEKRLAGDERHAEDAAEDVEAVKAGRRVEDRAEERDVGVEARMEQVPILVGLDREKDRSEKKGHREEDLQLALVAVPNRFERLHHRHRGADQD